MTRKRKRAQKRLRKWRNNPDHNEAPARKAFRLAILRANPNYACPDCGVPLTANAATIDHVVPRSLKLVPSCDPSNWRVVCQPCNLRKGNRHPWPPPEMS